MNLCRRTYDQEIVRHSLVGINYVESHIVASEPCKGCFAWKASLLALINDKGSGAFARLCLCPPVINERLKRIFNSDGIGVRRQYYTPPHLAQITSFETARYVVCRCRGALLGANNSGLGSRSRSSIQLMASSRRSLSGRPVRAEIPKGRTKSGSGLDFKSAPVLTTSQHFSGRPHVQTALVSAAAQIAWATSGPAMSLCAPLAPSPWRTYVEASRL